ncbi:SphA family protein [Rhizobium herbae]
MAATNVPGVLKFYWEAGECGIEKYQVWLRRWRRCWLPALFPAFTPPKAAAGFYLLGSKGPAAAILPPPGVFFQNDVYYYQGDLGGDRQLPLGGKLVGAVDASVVVELPTFIWVTPWDLAGGNFALTATLPIGWKDVAAKADLASPLGPVSRSVSDDVFTVGDPIVSGLVGWHSGDFHWQTGVLVNVPIGDYQKGALANIAFNHWGADVFAAGTWFNPDRYFRHGRHHLQRGKPRDRLQDG